MPSVEKRKAALQTSLIASRETVARISVNWLTLGYPGLGKMFREYGFIATKKGFSCAQINETNCSLND